MNRRELYALGEPFGDSCTRIEGGRRIYGGGSSKSSSSSSSSTNTTNIDRRQVVDAGGVGVSSDGGSVSITNQNLDAGIVTKALDTVQANDATNGQGFTQLLSLADKLFTAGGDVLQQQSQATMQQVAALNTIANDQKGQIDQKTLVILGVVGVAALYARKR